MQCCDSRVRAGVTVLVVDKRGFASHPQLILLCCIHSVPWESLHPRRGASLWTVTHGFAPAGCQSLSGCVQLQLHQFLFYFGLEAGGKLTNVT